MNLYFDFKTEKYESKDHEDWLCVMPTCQTDSDYRGYRIFRPEMPFISGHPTFVFQSDGFVEISTIDELPRYGYRFQTFHSRQYNRAHDDLFDILTRNRILSCQKLRIEANHSFFGNLMGLFDQKMKLECILMLEERMEFDIGPCHHVTQSSCRKKINPH